MLTNLSCLKYHFLYVLFNRLALVHSDEKIYKMYVSLCIPQFFFECCSVLFNQHVFNQPLQALILHSYYFAFTNRLIWRIVD